MVALLTWGHQQGCYEEFHGQPADLRMASVLPWGCHDQDLGARLVLKSGLAAPWSYLSEEKKAITDVQQCRLSYVPDWSNYLHWG